MVINITAFIVVIFLTILIQKIFINYKKFDEINQRSSHTSLATRTGGIGIVLSLFLISIYNYSFGIEIFDYSLFIPLGIMFIVGVYDDLHNANFKLKFFLQIIVAKILIDQGLVITNYHGLFGLYEVSWIIAQLTTVFFFLVIVNAINFIDGIDGLAITEVIKILLIIKLFSGNSSYIITLNDLIISSLIPLYYFNFKENNKVFLGDGGSLFLGTLVGISILHVLGPEFSFKEGFYLNKTIFTSLICIYPLTDLLRVFIIRVSKGKSPFSPDKKHIHHLLMKRLNSELKVIFGIQVLSVSFLILIYLINI